MTDRTKRHGPKPLDDPRTHCVSTRLSSAELAQLDAQRGRLARGEYLRCAALDVLPPVIPSINLQAWQELSRVASNLNQIARATNTDPDHPGLSSLRQLIAELRAALVAAHDR